LPVKEGTGKDLSEYYRKKQFNMIMKYAMEEFTFEQLYLALRKLVVHTQKKVTYSKSFGDKFFTKIVGKPIINP
jgi:hypothetical protein